MSGSLTCPKCNGAMRTYERSGVTVDQCGECRGIFLDRGELERLIDGEQAWHSDAPPREAPYQSSPPYRHERTGYREYGDHDGYPHDGYSRKRRKKSFLDELFD
jgi:uncharacterized protein